jgi:predicted small metal-binding protein
MEKTEEREKTCLFLIDILNEHISETLEFTNIREELMERKQRISKLL